ncbi:glycosyltransferase family 4 protein [Planctomicrobium sp. SH661]|uniref:glycosyltransferase family 4 protein n=1 Tax=Planctomicrobium sp. SH661 TaxID=3448124 RepID=UPI003F5C7A8E
MPLRVCVVALNAYPVIDPRIPGPIGGIETRSWMLAQGLANVPGIEVSFVVRHAQPLLQPVYQGIPIHLLRDRLYAKRESLALRLQRRAGFPWISLRAPRWSDATDLPIIALERICKGRRNPLAPSRFFEQLPADIFLTFGVQGNSAAVIASAHSTGRKAVLSLASDGDLDPRLLSQDDFVGASGDPAAICRWIITHSDEILCQTPRQVEILKSFQRAGGLLLNPFDVSRWDADALQLISEKYTGGLKRYVLWIGRADPVYKQPLKFVELAQACPEVDFLMILNPRDDEVEREVRSTAPSNVRVVERVPYGDMAGVLQRAAVLVNTSSQEGFPNTFLQAAASGVPIASLNVEPDFLNTARAGFCAEGDLSALAEYVQECWTGNPGSFDANSARDFVVTQHSLEHVSHRLAEVLQTVAEKPAT